MHLGRHQLGQWVSIPFQAIDGSDAPTAPTSVPTFTTYDSASSAVDAAIKVPLWGTGTTGRFFYRLFLDASYSVGHYTVRGEYTVGAVTKNPLYFFEVIAGGDAKGAYRSLAFYDRSGGEHLIGETDDGSLDIKRGPYL